MRILNQMVNVRPVHDEMPNGVGFERNQGIRLGSIPRGETYCDNVISASIQFPHQEVFLRGKGMVGHPGSHVMSLCSGTG